jgi:prevent-host-death family protein
MTQTLNITLARSQLSQLVGRAFRGEARVLIEKSGIPVAALVSAADLERLMFLEERQQADFAVLDRMREAFADVAPADLEREVAQALTQARSERRTQVPAAART